MPAVHRYGSATLAEVVAVAGMAAVVAALARLAMGL